MRLDTIVQEHAAVVDFYQWFVTRQSERHQEATQELEELEDKKRHLKQKIEDLEDIVESAEKTAIGVREERDKHTEHDGLMWGKTRKTRGDARRLLLVADGSVSCSI